MELIEKRQTTSVHSKHLAIAGKMRASITNGDLRAGDKLPTYAEVQDSFGVARNTADKAFALLAHEGLVVRKRGSGIYVADRAQRVRRHAIGLMGFWMDYWHMPYWMHLMEGIRQIACPDEREVLLVTGNTLRGLDRVDGVLVHGYQGDLEHLPPGMPAVSMIESAEGHASVVADDFGGTRAATRHLLELGHRRIAYCGLVESKIVQCRLDGYRAALHEAGVMPDEKWVRPMHFYKDTSSQRERGRRNMLEWLEAGWKQTGCTALLAQNDLVALGCITALQKSGYRVPDDVSVVGFDGTEEGEHAHPSLTSIAIPLEKIGAQAAELLLRQIHEEKIEPVTTVLPAQLQIRDSTAPVKSAKKKTL